MQNPAGCQNDSRGQRDCRIADLLMQTPNSRPPLNIKSGSESFGSQGNSAGFKLSDYWRWSGSDLLSNTQRGVIAEFLVANAMGVADSPRLEWGWFDLETTEGKKIEVKSAAYYQSWPQDKPSVIRFNLAPRIWFWDPVTNESENFELATRRSDAYVFCLLGDPSDSNPDPLDLDQWSFYVINTGIINRKVKLQKTIGLNSLKKLIKMETGRCEVKYPELPETIIEQLSL